MQETRDFLRTDLQRLFNSGEITTSRYSRDIRFEDPISKYDSLDGYLLNIRALRTFFHIKFDLHTIDVSAPEEITARWTMSMEFWLLPWKPTLLFTGRTFYTVNPDNGLVLSHTDVWDAVSNNRFLSLEALQHVLRMFLEVQLTPSLETPRYSVLRKTRDYEIRQYESYVVAETDMPRGSGPAAGTGFTDLAGYIFGGNQENARMEMTTPVFTTADPSAGSTSTSNIKMQFVMEERFRDPQLLPSPKDGRILTKKEDGGYFAVVRFSGWPLDFEVVRNERQLREALHRDGHKPRKGYRLARYNEPYVPPFVRRNEVLIELDEFVWP